jgi:DNA-binding transcriptional MerR regulator
LAEPGDRDHLSIGEVLSLLKDEFPDVTISKIRFLESQGLLDPERTPSGYRKFYDQDVERLRWILRQQRENFLPLKVIRGKLGEEEIPGSGPATRARALADALSPDPASPAEVAEPASPAEVAEGPSLPEPAEAAPPRTTVENRPKKPPTTRPMSIVRPRHDDGEGQDETLTFDEVCESCGLAPERLRELERFGMLSGRSVAGSVYYDSSAIAVARLAAAFVNHGIEPRHLKMYKNTAEREVALFEQVVTPLLKQRNPRSRQQASDTLDQLLQLAEELRGRLMGQAVDERGLG